MKVVTVDIETSPHVAHVWGTRKQYIAANQIVTPSRVLCVGVKVLGEPGAVFAEWHRGGRRAMLAKTWAALDEADAVVHYNGTTFDVPHLNREFLLAGLTPPSPYKQIDLWRTVSRAFRFPHSRLDSVTQALGLGGKLHVDHGLWARVLAGDVDARREMEEYNLQDIDLEEALYLQLRPWTTSGPNAGLYADDGLPRCTACGSDSLARNGHAYTAAGKFPRYRCRGCGKNLRGLSRAKTTPMREAL